MRQRTIVTLTLLTLGGLAGLLLVRPTPTVSAADKPAPASEVEKTIVPFVEKHCIACHGPDKKKGDLVLNTYRDEQSIIKGRKVWTNVLKMVQAGEMPPQKRPRPTSAEIDAVVKTVNTVWDNYDRTAPRDPGHITIRRLNRSEYNNTIRDLVGVDFEPAADFPSDDVGHGFDNIGDVLSLSPVHLERYLVAAESIAKSAVLLEAPKPPLRPTAAQFLQPGVRGEPGVREMTSRDQLSTRYRVTQPGEYIFRVLAYGKPADNEAPSIAMFFDGKQVQTTEVTATNDRPAGRYEAKVTLKPGEYRAACELVNPTPLPKPVLKLERGDSWYRPVLKEVKPPTVLKWERSQLWYRPNFREVRTDVTMRTLFVRRFELEGPSDTLPESHKRIMACNPKATHEEQTREILTRFVTKAYRRPATTDEIDRLAKLVADVEKHDKWQAGIQFAMQAVLCSPKFLFRIELDDRPDSRQAHAIDEYQLASRLSYFLWSTMPDDELFDLAAKKQLSANLDKQVQRMLKDPKSKALVENFALQWLQLRPLKNFSPDPKLFPTFDEQLRSAMFKETELFFDSIMRENRSILDLIDADYSFLNDKLARHYGIADTVGTPIGQKATRPGGRYIPRDEFVRVQFAEGSDRGGLLTQASVLAVTSNPTRTSPVKRGRWVLEQLLGTPPPSPPADVPALDDNKRMLTGSLRQRMEQHRSNPTCANCHASMDPLGFAFENYNAVGAFRTKDEGFAIDPSGTLPSGQSFKGPQELKTILKGKKELFSRNLAEKMLIYALGRGLEYYDRRTVSEITVVLAKNDYRFSALVVEIVKSDPFRLRRGSEQKD
jgi:mono/diheme cytochrome c family protein